MHEQRRMLQVLMFALVWALNMAWLPPAWALEPAPGVDATTALEERVNHLASELRCLVCQNQSIADSHAPLAVQLKQELRSQLAAGASDASVRDFMVQRYGEFVLYRPPMTAHNLALWLGPLVILSLALVALGAAVRSRRLHGDDGDEDDASSLAQAEATQGQA
jgi:cytochrome c-type biogenesis protein CcmH